jgi:hypothetical protein
MAIRILATLSVALGAASLLLGSDAGARSPGFAARPPAAIRATAGRPVLHAGTGMRAHAFRTRSRSTFLRRGRFGSGWWGPWGSWDGYPGYGSYSPDYSVPYDWPAAEPPELVAPVLPRLGYSPMGSLGYPPADKAATSVYVIPYRPGCDSQTQNVPWRNGSERSVTIVRC